MLCTCKGAEDLDDGFKTHVKGAKPPANWDEIRERTDHDRTGRDERRKQSHSTTGRRRQKKTRSDMDQVGNSQVGQCLRAANRSLG